MQNQLTSQLISTQKMSHKHNSKDFSAYDNSCVSKYVPYIYSHARWEFP